jgi:hypothetical protein
MAFYFWTKPFGTCKKKREKQHHIKEGWYQDIWRLKNSVDLKSSIFMGPKNTQKFIDHQKLGT